jgi:integrase
MIYDSIGGINRVATVFCKVYVFLPAALIYLLKEDKHLFLLQEVNFHGLRHTSATLLINQGVDISRVSKRLGHARTSTAMDIYSHSLLKADTEASTKLDILFNKKAQNTKQG